MPNRLKSWRLTVDVSGPGAGSSIVCRRGAAGYSRVFFQGNGDPVGIPRGSCTVRVGTPTVGRAHRESTTARQGKYYHSVTRQAPPPPETVALRDFGTPSGGGIAIDGRYLPAQAPPPDCDEYEDEVRRSVQDHPGRPIARTGEWIDLRTHCVSGTNVYLIRWDDVPRLPRLQAVGAAPVTLHLVPTAATAYLGPPPQVAAANNTIVRQTMSRLVEAFTALNLRIADNAERVAWEDNLRISLRQRWDAMFKPATDTTRCSEYVLIKRHALADADLESERLFIQPFNCELDRATSGLSGTEWAANTKLELNPGPMPLCVAGYNWASPGAPVNGPDSFQLRVGNSETTSMPVGNVRPEYTYSAYCGEFYADDKSRDKLHGDEVLRFNTQKLAPHEDPGLRTDEPSAAGMHPVDLHLFPPRSAAGDRLRHLWAPSAGGAGSAAERAQSFRQWYNSQQFQAYAARVRTALKRGNPADFDDDDMVRGNGHLRAVSAQVLHSHTARNATLCDLVRLAAACLVTTYVPPDDGTGGGAGGGVAGGGALPNTGGGGGGAATPSSEHPAELSSRFYRLLTDAARAQPVAEREATTALERMVSDFGQAEVDTARGECYTFCDETRSLFEGLITSPPAGTSSGAPPGRASAPARSSPLRTHQGRPQPEDRYVLKRAAADDGRRRAVLPGVVITYGEEPHGWHSGSFPLMFIEATQLALWMANTACT